MAPHNPSGSHTLIRVSHIIIYTMIACMVGLAGASVFFGNDDERDCNFSRILSSCTWSRR
jgi:hypothetical protein